MKNKFNLISLIVILTTCFSLQAMAASFTPIAVPKPAKSFFDGIYLGVGAGVVSINADIKNDYTSSIEEVSEPQDTFFIFNNNNNLDNLGKHGFGTNIFAGFGRVFDESKYLGIELFLNYLTPNPEGSHTDIVLEQEQEFYSASVITKIKNRYSYGGNIRVGYLISPRNMIYGLFGVDYSKFDVNSIITVDVDFFELQDPYALDITNKFSKKKIGYVPGIGIEIALNDNMSLRSQYTYTFYPSFKHNTTNEINTGFNYGELDIPVNINKSLTTKVIPNRGMFSLMLSWYLN